MFCQAVEGFTAMMLLANTFNALKPSALGVGLFMAAAQIAPAQDGLIFPVPSTDGLALYTEAGKEKPSGIVYVEAHDVLILDASPSMTNEELGAVFQGVRDYYLSDEALLNYQYGLCTANTVVYFATVPIVQSTHILCSQEDVERFVSDNVDPLNMDVVRALAGGSTYVHEALSMAAVVYDGEKDALGIETTRRRVVLAGDELGIASYLLRKASDTVSSYGVTVSAVAIGEYGEEEDAATKTLRMAFEENVVTHPGAKYNTLNYDGSIMERRLAPGMAFSASKPEEISGQLKMALSLGGF